MPDTFKEIPMDQWDRKNHHQFFIKNFHLPHISVTAHVNITSLLKTCNKKGISIFHSTVYLISKALNGIPQFRQRIRENAVIEWAVANPSYTILSHDEKLLFCEVEYQDNFSEFYKKSLKLADQLKVGEVFHENPEKTDNLLLMSCIPWVSFTAVNHPLHSNLYDSMPRVAWGKYFSERNTILMPFNIQAHHSVVDGLHIGRAFKAFQEQLDNFKP